jgi:hypothetical protein
MTLRNSIVKTWRERFNGGGNTANIQGSVPIECFTAGILSDCDYVDGTDFLNPT